MSNYTIGFDKLGIDLDKLSSTGYCTCPECSSQRKQGNRNSKVLKVYPNTGFYDCKHCGWTGRVDSNEWLEKQHGIETGLITTSKSAMPQNAPKCPTNKKPFILAPLIESAYEYLQNRGISKETATSLQLAYKQGCLAFNYYQGLEIVGAKYRKMASKFFWQHAECEKILYNINNLKDQEEIMIVEGEFDVLAVYECGFHSVGSVSQGAPNAGQQVGSKLQCLDNSIKYIKDAKRVLIWTDNDPNGIYLKRILVERFGADRCAIVEMPNDLINKETGKPCKDANDVLIFYGKEKVLELIKEAKDTPISGVRTLKQVESEMWETYHNGYRLGVKTTIRSLDKKFSFYKPWWNLFYGIPNSGKSELTLFLMMCMSVVHGWKWACFVPEAYPAGDFYNDCVSKLTGRGVDIGSRNRLTEQEYQVALDFVNEHFFFIYPQDDKNAEGEYMANNFQNVIAKIKELKLSKGIDGFLIDPINQLTASSEFAGTKDEKLEKMYGAIDILCKTHNLSGNLVAHPRTLYKEKDVEDYRPPTPYEIAGGAMNYNKAYCIILAHRPFNQSNKMSPQVEVDVQKVKKHKVAGTPGMAELNFDKDTGWYRELDSSCVLDGFFNSLMPFSSAPDAMENEETFTSRMNKENKSINGFNLDECPF